MSVCISPMTCWIILLLWYFSCERSKFIHTIQRERGGRKFVIQIHTELAVAVERIHTSRDNISTKIGDSGILMRFHDKYLAFLNGHWQMPTFQHLFQVSFGLTILWLILYRFAVSIAISFKSMKELNSYRSTASNGFCCHFYAKRCLWFAWWYFYLTWMFLLEFWEFSVDFHWILAI